ncbi:hypothetical protein KY290_030447 [Solanum tuberosum]|uniref:Cullin N-terminal domain-containing protein n=1 Tax=Solanum tuberosum TaxID=4113 RepID=A0ABQ7UNJ9_SOLTU|nr:hypothetical protein KY284_029468 [Solanum tuberosum]KAH0751215.1 hypothetical protein KY290_030447 [Solanum tuberosum]
MAKKLEKYIVREHLRVAELKPEYENEFHKIVECAMEACRGVGSSYSKCAARARTWTPNLHHENTIWAILWTISRAFLLLFHFDCDKMPASIIEMNLKNIIEFEEGWHFIQEAIEKVKRVLEGQTEPFRIDECMMLYTLIYNMCSQKRPYSYASQLYDKFKEALDEYINSTVLPALREKQDAEFMLRELVKRWENYKRMLRWLFIFFHYLSRYHIARRSLPTLNDVYKELSSKAINAVIMLIEKEREGEQIDRALLKNVLGIFAEIGRGEMEYYVSDFEDAMLRDTAAYYSRKASSWIVEDSYSDYMLKVEECLKKEKDRVSHYLHVSTEKKLLEKVKHELFVVYTNQLLEKEHSESRALLRDDKAESSGSFCQMIP